jgi:hypothetical protein
MQRLHDFTLMLTRQRGWSFTRRDTVISPEIPGPLPVFGRAADKQTIINHRISDPAATCPNNKLTPG